MIKLSHFYLSFMISLTCFGIVTSSRNSIMTPNRPQEPRIQRIIHVLQNLEEECTPQGGWNSLSTHRGKLTCKVNGESVISKLKIVLGKSERTVRIFNIQRLTCENPACSLEIKERNNLKWSSVSSKMATNISLRAVTHITGSRRFGYLVYGVGKQRNKNYHILHFDLDDNFRVTEHVLFLKQSSSRESWVIPCGLTTGACPGKHDKSDTCIYFCYCVWGHGLIFEVFEEPGTNKDASILFLTMKDVPKYGRIYSAALDGNGHIFMIVNRRMHGPTRMVVGVIGVNHTAIKVLRFLNLKFDPLTRLRVDINRNGVLHLANHDRVAFFVIERDIMVYDTNWFTTTRASVRELPIKKNRLACWVQNGKGLAIIGMHSPFKRRSLLVKPFK